MKRVVFNKSLLVLLVSVLITSFSLSSFAQRGPKAFRDSANFGGGIPNLTEEQQTKIQDFRVKHIKEVTPLKNELAEKKAHLKTLESSEKVDKDAINKTIDEISALQGKLMKMRVNHQLEVASVLTDEQKVFFNAHKGMKGKMGKHNGMGKGMKNRQGGNGNICPNNNPNCPLKK